MSKLYQFSAVLVILTSFISTPLQAQITEDTYHRAEYFLSNSIQREVYHLEVDPNWIRGSADFWHQAYTPAGKRFFITDGSSSKTKELFDHQKLARLLSEKTGASVDARNLPFDRIQVDKDGLIEFEWRNQQWKFDPKTESLTSEKKPDRGNYDYSVSPDGKWKAYTQNFNLFVENLETGEVNQLSFDGKKGYEYASYWGWSDMMYGENGERPAHFMARWSPDSKFLLTQVVDLRLAEKMFLLDYSQEDKFRPQLQSYYRGSPGDSTVVTYTPVLFDIEHKKESKYPALRGTHFNSLNLRWSPDSQTLNGFFVPRGFKEINLLEMDRSTGSLRKIYSEASKTNINTNPILRRLENGQFIISSEKSGWNQLYLYDWDSGRELQSITQGEFVVKNITYIDEAKGVIYFEATGREKDVNPYYNMLYKINLDGSDLQLLTPEKSFHGISYQDGKDYFVDNYSRVDQPTISVIRELETGKILQKISEADISNLKKRGYDFPKPFTAIGKDSKTPIYGIYYVPTTFDPNKKYPVVDYTYTGPHIDITPKTFKSALIGLQQSMAELGMVVITVDGLGTAGRGKAFHDFSYNNLGDGTTDHVLAIQQLASQVDFLDIDKVGIFGHSAGGYDAARAMLLHPEFYKVGVASAGDHDHRMEKAWWPEMYMGYPVGDFYHNQSNVTNAANLQGHLLLAHGGIDENVNPSATYKLAEALIAAGKDFDLFIWPSRNHSFGRTNGDYFTKKRWDYFIEHLLDQEPIRHYQIKTD
ncbi:S9 family peptidase [Algoriphagus vanfongensis]|uniref:S9 family peptidase n=1 Tax=Algoriphagus vanfongensis TaxID=426371 RepID=UPI0004207819|nr:DPP IV N-terminal domain-containing protein [Algoriphagus vanfongensis]